MDFVSEHRTALIVILVALVGLAAGATILWRKKPQARGYLRMARMALGLSFGSVIIATLIFLTIEYWQIVHAWFWLIPFAGMIVLAFMGRRRQWHPLVLIGSLAGAVVFIALGIWANLAKPGMPAPEEAHVNEGKRVNRKKAQQTAETATNEVVKRICNDGDRGFHILDESETPANAVEQIVLRDDCFVPFKLPKAWLAWHAEAKDPKAIDWASISYLGIAEISEKIPMQDLNIDNNADAILLEGRGELDFRPITAVKAGTSEENDGGGRNLSIPGRGDINLPIPTLSPERSSLLQIGRQSAFHTGDIHEKVNYSTNVCNDAFGKTTDLSGRGPITDFTIELHEGCFSSQIILPETWPNAWTYWRHQNAGSTDGWVAFWFSNYSPAQPEGLDSSYSLSSTRFRVQGKGTLRIYKIP